MDPYRIRTCTTDELYAEDQRLIEAHQISSLMPRLSSCRT